MIRFIIGPLVTKTGVSYYGKIYIPLLIFFSLYSMVEHSITRWSMAECSTLRHLCHALLQFAALHRDPPRSGVLHG